MSAIFDTRTVRQDERFAYWRDVVCEHFVLADSLNRSQGSFDARLTSGRLGAFELGALEAPDHLWSRKRVDIRQDDQDDFLMSYLVEGRGHLAQSGRIVRQLPGDIVIYDARRPFEYELAARTIVFKMPRGIMLSQARDGDRLGATRIGAGNPLRDVLGSMLVRCADPGILASSKAVANAHLGAGIVNMLLALVDLDTGDHRGASRAQGAQLDRAKRFAIANLGNAALTATEIASGVGVSPRTLNRLFAQTGTTPMRWLWQQRLDACHREISTGGIPRVTDVALRFGFNELSHFSRSFKAAYGVTPQSLLRLRGSQRS